MTRDFPREPAGATPASRSTFDERFPDIANRLVIGIAPLARPLQHGLGLYILLPLLAPIFMQARPDDAGAPHIRRLQLPLPPTARPQLLPVRNLGGAYLHELEATGMPAGLDLFSQRRFVGNELAGFSGAVPARPRHLWLRSRRRGSSLPSCAAACARPASSSTCCSWFPWLSTGSPRCSACAKATGSALAHRRAIRRCVGVAGLPLCRRRHARCHRRRGATQRLPPAPAISDARRDPY